MIWSGSVGGCGGGGRVRERRWGENEGEECWVV